MKQLQAKFYALAVRAANARGFMSAEKQTGATAIEYAMIAAVMVVAVAAAFLVLGEGLEGFFDDTVLPALENPEGADGGGG